MSRSTVGVVLKRSARYVSPLAGDGRISVEAAAQKFRLKGQTLRDAIDNKLVRGDVTVRGKIRYYTVDPAELEQDLANRRRFSCTYPGCTAEALPLSAATRCFSHTGDVKLPGHAPAGSEERARMSFGKLGVERPDVAERYARDWDRGGPLVLALMYTPDGKSKGYFKPETREYHGPRHSKAIARLRGKTDGRPRALSPTEEREVYDDWRSGVTQETLAERYGVGRNAIRGAIARGRRGEVSTNL